MFSLVSFLFKSCFFFIQKYMVIIYNLWYNMYSALKGCLMDKKLAKDIRRFSLITNTAFTVITTIFMGVGLGMLLNYLFEKEYWTPICSVLFTFIAHFDEILRQLSIAHKTKFSQGFRQRENDVPFKRGYGFAANGK